jgi:hypothetical protein
MSITTWRQNLTRLFAPHSNPTAQASVLRNPAVYMRSVAFRLCIAADVAELIVPLHPSRANGKKVLF